MTPFSFMTRLAAANTAYDTWESRFMCNSLVEYIEGMQWGVSEEAPLQRRNRPYVVNLIAAALDQKRSTLLFTDPEFMVKPVPGNSDWNLETAVLSANRKEYFLNTIVGNPSMDFAGTLDMLLLDSATHFGVAEVNYAADWRNPLKDVPVLSDDGEKVVEDYEVLEGERIYVKRIPPWTFRVAAEQASTLERNTWYGYYEYRSRYELQHADGIKWPQDWKLSSKSYENGFEILSTARQNTPQDQIDVMTGRYDVIKVWHIWDNSTKMRTLRLEGDFEPLWKEPFKNCRLPDLRWNKRQVGWYPKPLIWDWIPSQDEINESREQQRSYRRRFTRKFAIKKGSVSTEEQEKFAGGQDGDMIEIEASDIKNAIVPIDNPQLGVAIGEALMVSKDDFNIVSSTSSDLRGQTDRTTATQATITNQRTTARDSFSHRIFGNYVGRIGDCILLTAIEKIQLPFWIKYAKDPGEGITGELDPGNYVFEQFSPDELNDGYNFTVQVDAVNATPAAQEEQKRAFIEFITLVKADPMIAMSGDLIRETAFRVGYRNEKIIREFQRVAQLSIMAQAAQSMGTSGAPESNDANNNAAALAERSQANMPGEVQSQLEGQMIQ